MSTLALIACSKSKLDRIAPARELYTGALFKKALAYAERNYTHIAILSARYGLVRLDQRLPPYEKTLNTMPIFDRRIWALIVRDKLKNTYPKFKLVYFAGQKYVEFLPQGQRPLYGLKQGEQLQWLNRNTR